MSRQGILLYGPRLRRWILAIVVAGLPLTFLRFTNDPFNVPKLALLATGVSVVVAIRLIELVQGASWGGLTRLLAPASAIILPLLLAWTFTPYRYWSLFGHYGRFQGLIPYLLAVGLGILVADAFAEDLRHLAWALTIAGGVAGAYAILQFVGMDPFTWAQQFGGETTRTSTLGNPNFTGGFLAIVLPIALGLWRAPDPSSRRALHASILIGGGLFLSFSQGGYAAALAAGLVVAGFLLSERFKVARTLSLVAVAGLAALILGAVGYAMMNPGSEIVPATTAQRALWWRGAVSMVADYPLLGRGPNAYAVEGNRYRPAQDAAVHGLDYSDDTHSVPLAFATSAGLLGLLGYVVLVGWSASKAVAASSERTLQVGFVAAAAAYFVQSLVSIDEIALRTTFWGVLGGIAASFFVPAATKPRAKRASAKTQMKRTTSKTAVQERPMRLPLVGVVALLGLLGIWWSTAFVLNDARVRWAITSFRAGEPERGQEDFDRALAFRADYHYRHLNGFFAGERALSEGRDGSDWLAKARDSYRFLDRTPLVPPLRDYARLLHAYSEFDPSLGTDAADRYLGLIGLDPYNVSILREAIPVLAEDGRFEAVVAALDGRIDVVGSRAPSLWGYLAWALAELGEESEAQEALDIALQADPAGEAVRRAQRLLGD